MSFRSKQHVHALQNGGRYGESKLSRPIKPPLRASRIRKPHRPRRVHDAHQVHPRCQIRRTLDRDRLSNISRHRQFEAPARSKLARNRKSSRDRNFPNPKTAAVFDYIDSVADYLRIDWIAEPAHDSPHARLIISIAQFRQFQVQQILARVVERPRDAVPSPDLKPASASMR